MNWIDRDVDRKTKKEIRSNPNQYCFRCVRHTQKSPAGNVRMVQTIRFRLAMMHYLQFRTDKRRVGVFVTGTAIGLEPIKLKEIDAPELPEYQLLPEKVRIAREERTRASQSASA